MNNKIANQLNDLITLNNDRIAGYQKVVADIKDENIDIKSIFLKYAEQSRKFSQELTQIVAQQGEDVETGTTLAGSLHRAWIDIKSVFGGSDRKSILDEAERGEDVIKKAYKDTVESGKLSGNALEVVMRQQAEIEQDYNVIKDLRDASK